jgi:hypothetical protein
MHQFSYADIQTVRRRREGPRAAVAYPFDRNAGGGGGGHTTRWRLSRRCISPTGLDHLVEDLGSSDNALPRSCAPTSFPSACVLREAEDIRQGRTDNFEGLIEVTQIIGRHSMTSALKISLKPNEKIYINGAVVRVDRKVTVELMNDVQFLLESHVIQAEDASTPLKQLYFILQVMLMNPPGATSRRATCSAAPCPCSWQASSTNRSAAR